MKTLLSFGLAALVMGSTAAQQTQPKDDAMHSLYATLQKAYNKGDFDQISSYFSSDFHWRQLDGKTLKLSDAKKEIKEELSNIQNGKWNVDLIAVVGSGPVETAIAQYSFKGIMLDDSHKPYHAEITTTERQNWVLSSGGWKLFGDVILSSKSKQNGLRVEPNVKTPDKPVQDSNSDGSDKDGMP